MLGTNTMPPSQIQGALPADPTGMIQTPVDPNLVPQLRQPPGSSFTNITPQILQILQQEQPANQVLAGTASNIANSNVNLQQGAPTAAVSLLAPPAAQNTS